MVYMLDRGWNEKVLTKTFRIPEELWKRIEAYKVKHYEGWYSPNLSEIMRRLLKIALDQDENKKNDMTRTLPHPSHRVHPLSVDAGGVGPVKVKK